MAVVSRKHRIAVRCPPCLRTEINSNANAISAQHEFADNPTTGSPYKNFAVQTLSIDCLIILIYLFPLFMMRSALVSRLSFYHMETHGLIFY